MRFPNWKPVIATVVLLALASFAWIKFAPSPPVSWAWVGGLAEDRAVVSVQVKDAKPVRIRLVSQQRDGITTLPTSKIFTPAASLPLGSRRVLRFELAGLNPATTYSYVLESDSSVALDSTERTLTTFPVPGTPASFRFALGACASDTNSPAFAAIARQQARFMVHTGDFHYFNIDKNKVELFRAAYDKHLSAPRLSAMLTSVPLIYQWDDHDYGKNDSNRTSNSRQASLQNYQEFIPHFPLNVVDEDTPKAGAPTDQAFTIGRVRFILSDLRSRRDVGTRRMMSAAQDAWLRAQLLDAKGKYPLIFWVSSVPWNGEPNEADRWQGFPAHRTEIADFIKANGITGVCVLAGDAHMVGIDDGSNSDFATGGGAPLRVFQAGPIANRGSYKAGPYSLGGNADSPPDGRLYHFGLVDVQDDGRAITVHWSGRDGSDGIGDKVLKAQRWGTGPIELTFKVE